MVREKKIQARVSVAVEALWRALATEVRVILPKAIPNLVKDVELVEGNGGLGTIFIFHFGPDVPNMTYQKEKIVEFDESERSIGLRVIEGGRLNHGFTSHATYLKLTGLGEKETLVDIRTEYDTLTDEEEDPSLPANTTDSTLAFLRLLEDYLIKTDG